MGTVLSALSTDESVQYSFATPRRTTLNDSHRRKDFKYSLAHNTTGYQYNNLCESTQKQANNSNKQPIKTTLLIPKSYELISDANTTTNNNNNNSHNDSTFIESNKSINSGSNNMFSLKRLIISSLSRKTKVADSCNGILPSMQMTNERLQRLSIASDRSNPMDSGDHQMECRRYLGNSTSRSTIEIPIYYYQQQEQQRHHQQQQTPQQFHYSGSDGDGDDSTKISMPTGLRPIPYTQTSGISSQNPYWFNSNDVMTDSITREYQTFSSSGQKSLTNFNTSFIQQKDSTHLPEEYYGQRRQLSEPNSRLKHRYSHCLSRDINGKCCPTHHNPQYYHQPRRHDNNITTKMNITGGHFSTTVSYTPSLIDLRCPTKFKSLHRKDSNEQLCVNSSPYSFIDNNNNSNNNKEGQNFQNSNYAYPPATLNVCEAGTMPSHQGHHDKSSPMDPYYPQYHVQPYPIYQYAHEQQRYQNPSNHNTGNDNPPWNRKDISPGARSCSTYDIPFPVYYNYDNHRMRGNSTLSVEKEHILPLPVSLCPSSTSIITGTTTTNSNRLQSGCVSERLTPDLLDIPNTNNNDNNNGMGNGNTIHGKYIQLSSKFGRRLTEFGEDLICPESPIHVQRKTGIIGFDKYRSITKSISCYALKLFSHHSNTVATTNNTNNNTNNSCQQKCKKLSVESTGLTKSSFRTNDIVYDRKMFKQRAERKTSDRIKRNSSQRDIGTLKGYHQQMNESSLMPVDTLTSTNKTSMSNSNSTIQYRNSDAQSTDRVKCFNYRKAISKTSGIYGLFENLKSDHKIDKNSNIMYFRNCGHNERYYYELNNSMMNATIAVTGNTATSTTATTTPAATTTTSTTTTGTTITSNMCNFFRQPIFKASTGELLKYLSFFIVSRIQLNLTDNSKRLHNSNSNLHNIQPSIIVAWIRSIDRALILQGWSEVAFINPTHIVFLYMMLKTFIENDHNIHTERELHTIIMACLYLAYSYIGNEISYPLRPFLIAEANQLISHSDSNTKKSLLNTTEHGITSGSGTGGGTGATTGTSIESCLKSKVIDEVRNRFWQYVIRVVNEKSSDMLRINADPMLFTQMFKELTSYESIFIPMKLPAVNRIHKQ